MPAASSRHRAAARTVVLLRFPNFLFSLFITPLLPSLALPSPPSFLILFALIATMIYNRADRCIIE
jgi:hypothetical protein